MSELEKRIEVLIERELHNRACWRAADKTAPSAQLTLDYYDRAEEALKQRRAAELELSNLRCVKTERTL